MKGAKMKEEKRICIIDNEIGSAYKVWEGLSRFYSDKGKMFCKIILIDFDKKDDMQESIDYFMPKFKKSEINICESPQEVQECLGKYGKEYIYLLDVILEEDISNRIKSDNYECVSMQIFQMLKEKKRYIYSRFIEMPIMSEWIKRWEKLYPDIAVPEVLERERLVISYFDEILVKKILEI